MRKHSIPIICIVLILLLFACVSTSTKQTGFLSTYSNLIQDPQAEGLFYYENPTRRLYRYDSFWLAPILVYFDPDAASYAVDPERLVAVTEYFRAQILQSFQGKYRIVPTQGPDVCSIHIAVSGLIPEVSKLTADSKIKVFGLSGSALEVQLQDSKTGQPVFALWDTRQPDEYKRMHEAAAVRHAKKTIQDRIKILIKYMDQAYAQKPKKEKLSK